MNKKSKKNIKLFLNWCVLIVILFNSCNYNFNETINQKGIQWDFYRALKHLDYERVECLIQKGINPNVCLGDCGWTTSNPIGVVTHSYYNTYWRKYDGDIDQLKEPLPDVLLLSILVKSGADVNMRPYVWQRVHEISNHTIERQWKHRPTKDGLKEGVYEDMIDYTIKDANRVLKKLLELGADPDMLGHPYPFSSEAMEAGITDEQAKIYFEKGTRAINEAIQKGMVWESQVDLLLQYTNLDEASLRAAERSGDPRMVKKISDLWKKQCENGK